VLGSWGYAHNVARGESALGGLAEKTSRTSPLADNAVRVVWTFVDSPGIQVPLLGSAFPHAAHKVGQRFEDHGYRYATDTSVSEDTSSFGIVGWLLLGPLVLVYALSRKGIGTRRAWALAALLGLAAFVVAFEFNAWIGRLLLPTVALAAPLLAGLARRRALAVLAVVAAGVTVIPTLTRNENKPLWPGRDSVLHQDRIGQMTTARLEMRSVLRVVEQRVRPHDTLAFVGQEDSWDYPLCGAHRVRRIVRYALPRGPANLAALRATGARAALFANTRQPRAEFHPELIMPGYWFVEVR
jgi:hypothetical protein